VVHGERRAVSREECETRSERRREGSLNDALAPPDILLGVCWAVGRARGRALDATLLLVVIPLVYAERAYAEMNDCGAVVGDRDGEVIGKQRGVIGEYATGVEHLEP
jgi:hypothetical protein